MTSIAVFTDQVRQGLRQQANVVFALLFKDFRTRASTSAGHLGIFWTLATPMLTALALATMWFLLGRHEFYGVSPFLVMTAAIIPYQLIRRSLSSIPAAVSRNMDLYSYPQVKPIDAILARFILDTTLTILAGVLLILGFYWFLGLVPAFFDPLATIGMFGLLLMMMMGISLTVGVYSTISDTFDRILGFATRPLVLFSLVIHLGIQLPPTARYWVSWNPLADINELVRFYMLGIPPMPEATVAYPALVAVLMLAFGFITYYANRYRILRQE
jgi:capsular polysaccharide transport system permease protein